MPAIDYTALLQLGLLLFALPAQYLIISYTSKPSHQTEKAIKDFVATAKQLSTDLLSWPVWQRWCLNVWNSIAPQKSRNIWSATEEVADGTGESPAVDVMKYGNPLGYFAGSPTKRSPRPKAVKFRVGQVVKHRHLNYQGVVVGWDERAMAPEQWLQEHYKDSKRLRMQPFYSVLVDTRDRKQSQLTYVPQEHLVLKEKSTIRHPDVERYFDGFDGRQYIPRQALRELYPDD